MSQRPTELANDALLERSQALVAQIAEHEAELIEVLAEIERREIHVDEGYTSVSSFCRTRLDLSPWVAHSRSAVAKLSHLVPEVVGSLTAPREERIPLSGLVALAPHVTEENAAELIARASGRTKQQITAIIAGLPTYRPRLARKKAAETETDPADARLAPEPDPGPSVSLTLDSELEADIEKARWILQTEIPGGDLSKIVAWALRTALAAIAARPPDDAVSPKPIALEHTSESDPATAPPSGASAMREPAPAKARRLLKKRLWPWNQVRKWGA